MTTCDGCGAQSTLGRCPTPLRRRGGQQPPVLLRRARTPQAVPRERSNQRRSRVDVQRVDGLGEFWETILSARPTETTYADAAQRCEQARESRVRARALSRPCSGRRGREITRTKGLPGPAVIERVAWPKFSRRPPTFSR